MSTQSGNWCRAAAAAAVVHMCTVMRQYSRGVGAAAPGRGPRRLSFSSSEARQLKYCSPPWLECEEAAELGRPSMAHGEEAAGLITVI